MDDHPTIRDIHDLIKNSELSFADRNHAITRAYHHVSEAIRAKFDAGPNLDWCGFAKWSSHTVGMNFEPAGSGARATEQTEMIMKVLPRAFGFLRPIVEKLLKRFIDVENGLVAKALRGGNGTIFVEMGSIFVTLRDRFSEIYGEVDSEHPTEAELEKERGIITGIVDTVLDGQGRVFLAPLSAYELEQPDRKALVRGIEYYFRAKRDPARRAELMLAGNMLFSVYEQSRADRLIAIGMCAPVRARLVPLLAAPSGTVSSLLGLLAGPRNPHTVIRSIEMAVVRILTRTALAVRVADRQFRLGYPEELPPPTVIPVLPEVIKIMSSQCQWAAGRPRNWLDLHYRLAFISQYFAAVQLDPDATREPPHPDTGSTLTGRRDPDLPADTAPESVHQGGGSNA